MKAVLLLASLVFIGSVGRADIIECDNGDRFHGKVISMDEKQVTLKNDIAGTLTIPRQRIVSLSFREKAAPELAAVPRLPKTNSAALRPGPVKFDSAAVEKVRSELLTGANPQANQMFNEMVEGLASGKMNVSDIQRQARSTLKELRSMEGEFGNDETSDLLNSYAEILEGFLKAAPQQSIARTNAVLPKVTIPDEE